MKQNKFHFLSLELMLCDQRENGKFISLSRYTLSILKNRIICLMNFQLSVLASKSRFCTKFQRKVDEQEVLYTNSVVTKPRKFLFPYLNQIKINHYIGLWFIQMIDKTILQV